MYNNAELWATEKRTQEIMKSRRVSLSSYFEQIKKIKHDIILKLENITEMIPITVCLKCVEL